MVNPFGNSLILSIFAFESGVLEDPSIHLIVIYQYAKIIKIFLMVIAIDQFTNCLQNGSQTVLTQMDKQTFTFDFSASHAIKQQQIQGPVVQN